MNTFWYLGPNPVSAGDEQWAKRDQVKFASDFWALGAQFKKFMMRPLSVSRYPCYKSMNHSIYLITFSEYEFVSPLEGCHLSTRQYAPN
jgi:hypothetical protein